MLDREQKTGQFAVGVINKTDQLKYLKYNDQAYDNLIKEKPWVSKNPGDEKYCRYQKQNVHRLQSDQDFLSDLPLMLSRRRQPRLQSPLGG